MKKPITLILTIIFAVVLMFSGCLSVEKKEYYYKVNEDGTGEGKIKYINIISEMDDETDVSDVDFDELISNYLNGTYFEDENPYFVVEDKILFEENGVLCAEVSFTFNSFPQIGFYKYPKCDCSPIMYYIGGLSETYEESNGEYLGDESSMYFIVWEAGTKEFEFTTIVSTVVENSVSLLPRYLDWEANQ
ncbi:MAG: hypothetical protein JW866_01555 [Ignavibacteriales bacterium]|nr:hypothetical protein [Ignavibacteriales bacterium]